MWWSVVESAGRQILPDMVTLNRVSAVCQRLQGQGMVSDEPLSSRFSPTRSDFSAGRRKQASEQCDGSLEDLRVCERWICSRTLAYHQNFPRKSSRTTRASGTSNSGWRHPRWPVTTECLPVPSRTRCGFADGGGYEIQSASTLDRPPSIYVMPLHVCTVFTATAQLLARSFTRCQSKQQISKRVEFFFGAVAGTRDPGISPCFFVVISCTRGKCGWALAARQHRM